MQIRKRISALLLAIFLLALSSSPAYAQSVPDMSQSGSISAAMTYNGKAVPGGTLTIYKVGEISEDDGNYSFVLTRDFTGSGVSLEDISSSALAERLEKYISDNNLVGISQTVGSDGTVYFSGLELGLYLAVQTKAADGYEKAAPFMVSVPMYENGAYVYDVNATPKLSVSTTPAPTPTTPPSTTTTTTIPQTGQLNWPIPLLAALGLCMFLIGWALRFGKKGKPHGA